MTELFPVEVQSSLVPVAGDAPVVFHGINKSGSLAMAHVMRGAYESAGRGGRFASMYHASPQTFPEFAQQLERAQGHAFFVAHYLIGRLALPPRALLVTQLRHPLPRTLSVHGWLRGGHLRRHGSLDGFPDLERWIASTRGRKQTQMAQLAVGFGHGYRREVAHTRSPVMRERAMRALESDVAWFGIAELFEESIFTLAHVCGLDAVPAWRKDTRNRWRVPLADVEPRIVDLISERFAEEIAFYEHALALFQDRLREVTFGPSLARYQAACQAEYGERILLDSPVERRDG